MTRNVTLYGRVSSEVQDAEDRVSIGQQVAEMEVLCERNGWKVIEVFIDAENYRATQHPKKGKVVNPSGERADRPAFLAMLEFIKTGQVDAVVCWRDDRLVRHPRVAVALEDALDQGDRERKSKSKIAVYDATGAMIDRFTLSIKATVWREENKRRTERVKLGKLGSLKAGYWPSTYTRFGYSTTKEKRGRKIILAGEAEVQAVKDIFNWYDAGMTVIDIRDRLIKSGVKQKGKFASLRREWEPSLIYAMLRSEAYMGKAAWPLDDGSKFILEIPQIITPEQFERVQKKLDAGNSFSPRNTKDVYLLQGIAYCGECEAQLTAYKIRYFYKTLSTGERKRYEYKTPNHRYRCDTGHKDRRVGSHPQPYLFSGNEVDQAVWYHLVDNVIENPDTVVKQITVRQSELQAQGDSIYGEIAHARQRLIEVDQERAGYQRQQARDKITEEEFDARMDETENDKKYWQDELDRLTELKDDAEKIQSGLDYVTELMTTLQERLTEIDIPLDELKALPQEGQNEILEKRRKLSERYATGF